MAQTLYYVDPAFVGSSPAGTATHPWLDVSSGWTTINTSLASGAVTVFFSATASTTTPVTATRTDGTTNVLLLDGISQKNTNETVGSWTTNATPVPCYQTGLTTMSSTCVWQTATKFKITAAYPFSSNATAANCRGFITVQGFKIIRTEGQAVNLTYVHDLIFQYNEATSNAVGTIGPGVYVGPGNNGPCGVGGVPGGPNNVTIQFNYLHDLFEDCFYDGAMTPDPPGYPSTEYTNLGLTCTTTCNTGSNHLIQNNYIGPCATVGGTVASSENIGIDIKDGHAGLKILNNTIRPTYGGTFNSGAIGPCINAESFDLIDGNYNEGCASVGIAPQLGWNNSIGRSASRISNNAVVNVNYNASHNECIVVFGPIAGANQLWQVMNIYNNSLFTCGTTGGWNSIAINSGSMASAAANVENNVISGAGATISLAGGTTAVHDYNDCFNPNSCPGGETHSITTDPKYVSTTAPYSDVGFELQAGSGAIGAAVSLASTFTNDYFGVTRTVPWDMGFWKNTAAVAPVSYCGVSGDTNVHIPANYDTFAAPALGGTYTDAIFGCPITRLTDAVNNPGSQTCVTQATCQAHHFYATIVPDNKDHTIVHVTLLGLPALIAGPVSTYATPGTILVKQSNFPTANLTSQGFVVWDIQDPLTFYYTALNQFKMGKVTGLPSCAATSSCTVTSTTLGTFGAYTSISLMDDQDISEDGLHYYIGAHSGSGINDAGCASGAQLCDLVGVTLDAIGGAATTATLGTVILSNTFWHKVQAALANRVQVEAPGGVNTFKEYNPNGTLYATLPTSHHDFLHNPADNSESLVGPWNSGNNPLNVCPHHLGFGEVNTASATMLNCLMEVFLPGNGGFGIPPPTGSASHISTRDGEYGWALFEAESYGNPCPNAANPYCEPGVAPATTTMTGWGLYDGELVALKVDGSQLLRLAHHRSRSATGFYAGSRGVITRDAKYVYFDSNFNSCPISGGCGSQTVSADPNYSDVYVLQFQSPTACGPPAWICPLQGTSTQLSIIQQPPTPAMGNLSGMNLAVVPQGYGNTVVRCTDVNTASIAFTSHSYDVTDSGGGFDQIWNSTEDLLAVVETNTGQGTIMAFNSATNTCTSPQPALQIPTGRAFSRVNPNLLRVVPNGGSGTLLKDYTFNHLIPTTAPVITTEFDFGTCGGMSGITATWSASVTASANDVVVATGFSTTGGQNTGILVAVYNPSSGGCQVWNTNTGTITATGYGVSGTATTNFPFTIHDVTVWPGGWVEIGVGNTCTGCPSPHGPFFWQAGTLNTTLSTANSGGHNQGGYTNWYNISTSPRLCQRPFSNPTTCTFINTITGITIGTLPQSNSHLMWQNADTNETQPIFMSHTTTPNDAPTFTSPLQQEIFGALLNLPPNGRYVHITPTWTSGIASSYNFRAINAISAASPSGSKIAFASDWMCTLGNIDGVTPTNTCGVDSRNDVFIVTMPGGPPVFPPPPTAPTNLRVTTGTSVTKGTLIN